jgi:cellulose synthase/poly-beta-1,6-N-acetylglucosamine synthase-like glycosyltransferase
MALFIAWLLLIPAVVLAILVTVFLIEVLAAVAMPQPPLVAQRAEGSRHRVGVLVPAHNESLGLLPTLGDIRAQLSSGDRLLVVADNCTDDTASVAKSTRAEVIERKDPERRGKGYALDFGLRCFALDPPDIVIILDADCRLADATIDYLSATCARSHRPVQALNLMIGPSDSPDRGQVAVFAWRVKNRLRPLGLRALGLPCQLMGTGMAFPWDVIASVDLASGSIVEDMKLGHDLALVGLAPEFCPSASISSVFPSSEEGMKNQRYRWEAGHLGTILTTAPSLIVKAIARSNLQLFALALDVAVPPLSLLAISVLSLSILTCLFGLLGFSSAAMWVSAASLVGFVSAMVLCWLNCGRDLLPLGKVLSIASYVLRKLPIYRQILSRKRSSQWIRTDRSKTQ